MKNISRRGAGVSEVHAETRTEQKYLFGTPHGDNGWPYHFVACAGLCFKSEPCEEFLQGPATKAPAGSRTLHIGAVHGKYAEILSRSKPSE
ncbi:MAG: hypothetical protein ACI915_000123 [Gammaproteobacteria bacterium]|jgi:hypothetical protein